MPLEVMRTGNVQVEAVTKGQNVLLVKDVLLVSEHFCNSLSASSFIADTLTADIGTSINATGLCGVTEKVTNQTFLLGI